MKTFKLARHIINLVIYSMGCIWNFILWIISFGTYAPYNYTANKSYGGDAYTGIQNAAADAANNINDLTTLVEECFQIICTWFSFTLFVVFTVLILKNIESIISVSKERREERKKREAEFMQRQFPFSPVDGNQL